MKYLEQIIPRVKALVQAMVPEYLREDVRQHVYLTLLEAPPYDPSRCQVWTWAYPWARGAILRYLGRSKTEEECEAVCSRPSPEALAIRAEIGEWIGALTEVERAILLDGKQWVRRRKLIAELREVIDA